MASTANSIYYIDISKIGRDFTGNKDLSIITNDQALLESVMNILITEPGELVMNPRFGCNLSQFLFSPIDDITTVYIKKEIEDAINQFEPRVNNLSIQVTADIPNKTYIISVVFDMQIVSQSQTALQFSLNKIR